MPFLRAAPRLASPLLETARRKETPTANCAPWYGGSPEASTSAHRSPSALTATFLFCASSLASPRRSHRCLLSSGCERGCERVCDHCVHAVFFIARKPHASQVTRDEPLLNAHSLGTQRKTTLANCGDDMHAKEMRPKKKNQRTPEQPKVAL